VPEVTLPDPQPQPIEPDVFEIPIQLETALEPHRPMFSHVLGAAQLRLKTFATQYGWEALIQEPFARAARFYAQKSAFDQALLLLCGLDPAMELPETYCAALEEGVLMAVSPELYRTLYPEGDEADAFEKLLTHEMAHRLHIRILDGAEDAMGPIWFYEGFALFAASQLELAAPTLTSGEIWAVVDSEERQDYRRYATVFRHFLSKTSLQQLVEMAGKAEFNTWLKQVNKGNITNW
jgi:hypothetical protein